MDKKSEKVALNDELLDNISGGYLSNEPAGKCYCGGECYFVEFDSCSNPVYQCSLCLRKWIAEELR